MKKVSARNMVISTFLCVRYLHKFITSHYYQVEDSWKTTEFVVLLHRDYNDVFVLGGTDDIQVNNKATHYNINTWYGLLTWI